MSPIKRTEQISAPTTSTFRERWNRGELHHVTNIGSFLIDGAQMKQERNTIESLRQTYGSDAVVQSNAITEHGQPNGVPYQTGVYVDAQKWAKLHPEQ